MPDFRKAFPSKYLKSDDFVGRKINAQIERVTWEVIQEGQEEKPVVFFKGNSKQGMVFNSSNCQTVAAMLGSNDTDDWANAKIVFTVEEVKKGLYKGKNMFVVEVPEEMKPKKQEESWGDGAPLPNDDDIPF